MKPATLTPEIIVRASNVSMEAHVGQKRKYTGEPYWVHCLAVATQVEAWKGTDAMIAAAYLHDTLEDTDMSESRLHYLFGAEVANLVIELTDSFTPEECPDLNRAQRKRLEAQRYASRVSLEARVIKLADIADNTATIEQHDKSGFAQIYLAEKAHLVSLIGGSLNQWLALVESGAGGSTAAAALPATR